MDKTNIDQLVASLLAEAPTAVSTNQPTDQNGVEQVDSALIEATDMPRYFYNLNQVTDR